MKKRKKYLMFQKLKKQKIQHLHKYIQHGRQNLLNVGKYVIK
jgi:hypothetical protein